MPELIRKLRQDAELELGLSEMTTLEQVDALKSGRIDIAFGRLRIEDPVILQVTLLEDPLVAALPHGHRLAGKPVELAQLAEEPFILHPSTPRPSYADHVVALFAHHGLSLKINQWANELQTAIGLVAAGRHQRSQPRSNLAVEAPTQAHWCRAVCTSSSRYGSATTALANRLADRSLSDPMYAPITAITC